MILGVTGGMGCGKTTVAGLIESNGFARIDSDALVRDELLVRADLRTQIAEHFGAKVMRPDGSVNRSALGAVVFADDSARLWLEDLLHPEVFRLWKRRLDADPDGPWVLEVPLLFEKGLENWFDFIVCVASSPELQLARLEQRGLPRALAEQRISKQLPLARKIELADFVVWNDGSTGFLQRQVSALIQALPARS